MSRELRGRWSLADKQALRTVSSEFKMLREESKRARRVSSFDGGRPCGRSFCSITKVMGFTKELVFSKSCSKVSRKDVVSRGLCLLYCWLDHGGRVRLQLGAWFHVCSARSPG